MVPMAPRPAFQGRWCCVVLTLSLTLGPNVAIAEPGPTAIPAPDEAPPAEGPAPEAQSPESPSRAPTEDPATPTGGEGSAPEAQSPEPTRQTPTEDPATPTDGGAGPSEAEAGAAPGQEQGAAPGQEQGATPGQEQGATPGQEQGATPEGQPADADASAHEGSAQDTTPATAGLEPKVEVPPEPRIAGRSRTGKGMLIAGGTVLGAGLALTITFGAMTRGCRLDGPLECKYAAQDTLLIPLGVTVMVAGAMVLAVGAGYFVQYRRWQRAVAVAGRGIVVPTVARDAAGVSYVARF